MDTTKMWDYRVVRQTKGDDGLLSVQEVYYDDDGETPTAHTMDLQIEGDNISSLRKQLQSMLWCLDKEIVDEIESDVKTDTIEDRLSYLEDEVENIADAVSEFDNRVIRSIH